MTLDVRGKTVVLTGTFSKLKRADAEEQLTKLGAKIGSGVGKSTHVLFAGEKAGSKINAANALGVTVLGEDDLMAVLAGGRPAAPATTSPFTTLDPSRPGEALARDIAALPWTDLDVDRDLPALREALYAHEAAHGVTAAHRAATAQVRPLAVLAHAHGHDVEVLWSDLSPDGRFLATGSWTGDDYDLGGVLQIWDVRAGRGVNMLRIHGGVGWPDHGDCVQWRPDGRRVGLTFDTNGVGSFDPFAKSGEPESCAYITDGWDSPPAWAWSANSRDVYIACWGPDLALGAIVPLVGRRPAPRWCESLGRASGNDEPRLQPMSRVSWAHPDRIVGSTGWSQVFALDAGTGKLLWEGKAHPPIGFSPGGEEFAMHPAGIVYYDARTGLPNGKLPMHVGADSLIWSRDGKRMAALVQPGNDHGAEPGVFVYDAGTYRYSPDAAAPRTNGSYAAAWSPDGRRLAITSGGRLQVWELGEAPVRRLDVAAPAASVRYGDGVLIAWGGSGLTFVRETDGAVLGAFGPAVEADGEDPLEQDGEAYGAGGAWPLAFPIDGERVAAVLPEGVVVGPRGASASVAEIDARIAWVVGRKWAWPWRWGEPVVWPDAAAATADKAAPAAFKRHFAKAAKAAKTRPAAAATAPAPKSKSWPPPGGTLDELAAFTEASVRELGGGYHGDEYRRHYAVRTMALGMFDRAAAALDGEDWKEWADPWSSAYARGEVAMTALAGRPADAPALTKDQTATLRRWLGEADALMKRKEVKQRGLCRPLATTGAAWLRLGEARKGEKALAAAVAAIEPENNTSEHRSVVARAFAAVGRVREAIDHLTDSEHKPSWTETPAAIAAIAPVASAAELAHLFKKMQAHGAHDEFVLLERGMTRLISLQAWDAATRWIAGFEGLVTRREEARLATALAAAGEPARAEKALRALEPGDPRSADAILVLARILPDRARVLLDAALPKLAALLAKAHYPHPLMTALAGAAARLGRLDAATTIEAAARDADEAQAARLGVLAELDPKHPAWPEWFARAREAARDDDQKTELAALAHRGGLAEAGALLDEAIAAARARSSPDIHLERVSDRLAAVGDLTGAHRAFMAIARGTRSHRNKPLLAACAAAGEWAGALELLQAMPRDLNGAAKAANRLLLEVAGGEGW